MVALFWFCLRNHMFYFIRINQEYCKCFALLEYMTVKSNQNIYYVFFFFFRLCANIVLNELKMT